MMNKMNDILQQFRREIDTTTAIFHTLKVWQYAMYHCHYYAGIKFACLLVADTMQDSFVLWEISTCSRSVFMTRLVGHREVDVN